MLFKDVGYLITTKTGTNENGFPEEIEVSRKEAYLDKKSIKQGEFYQAAALGIELSSTFEMRSIDYSGETKLEVDGSAHYVVRTYDKNGEIIELVCSLKKPRGQ